MVKRKTEIYEIQPSRWVELVEEGTSEASSSLSRIVDKQIRITALDLKTVSASNVAEVFGGAEREVVAVYLGATGAVAGHIMLVYPKQAAFSLVDMLMDYEYWTTRDLGKTETSALAEIGNITGTYFLNSIAKNLGIRLMPTPPQVMVDMLGAILNVHLTDNMEHRDELFIMSTVFATDGQSVIGTLLVMPGGDLLDKLIENMT